MAYKIPVNGETFFPQLIVDWLTDIRTQLGLNSALNIVAMPAVEAYELPLLLVGCSSFKPTGTLTAVEYDITFLLRTDAAGDPVLNETPAQRTTRLRGVLTQENQTLALLRASISLRKGQVLDETDKPDVISFFDWCAARTVPDDEDGWELQGFDFTAGGGTLDPQKDARLRDRVTHAVLRALTNEFTV